MPQDQGFETAHTLDYESGTFVELDLGLTPSPQVAECACSSRTRSATRYEHARHFFIGSKDTSAQFLGQGLQVETFTDRPYAAVRDEALRRMDHWVAKDKIPPPSDGNQARSYPERIQWRANRVTLCGLLASLRDNPSV